MSKQLSENMLVKELDIIKFVAEDLEENLLVVNVTNAHIHVHDGIEMKKGTISIAIEDIETVQLSDGDNQVTIKTKQNQKHIWNTLKAKKVANILTDLIWGKNPEELRKQEFKEKHDTDSKGSMSHYSSVESIDTFSDVLCESPTNKDVMTINFYDEEEDNSLSTSSGSSRKKNKTSFQEIDEIEKIYNEISEDMCEKEDELSQFSIVKLIGHGLFGKVFLTKHNKTGKIYSMKRIRKDMVLRQDAVDNVSLEYKILSQIKHPLLLKVEHVLESISRFYFF